MNEIWKDIEGYVGFYQVSNLGRVRSMDRTIQRKRGVTFLKGKLLTLIYRKMGTGYMAVTLTRDSIQTVFLVHRLVASAFIPNPKNKPQVNHLVNDKGVIDTTDNRVAYLEWATNKENIRHAWDNKLCEKVRDAAKKLVIERNSRAVINTIDGTEFKTVKDAATSINMHPDTLSAMLRGDIPNKTIFRFITHKKSNKEGKLILNTENGIFYISSKEASFAYSIKRSTLVAMLRGQNRNRTSLIYV